MNVPATGSGIFDDFEGYRDPSEEEALELLGRCPVVIDTNVLLDIYSFEEPARALALDVLESIGDRLWVPHQVMKEFWRNRHQALADLKTQTQPLETVRAELLGIINSLRPDQERPDDIQTMRNTVESQLNALSSMIDKARGQPLDVDRILRDTSLDPILTRLEEILRGRVGPSLGDDEESVIEAGLERFQNKIPPGYQDGKDKQDQIPERGTGDYLIWEQTLRHITSLEGTGPFIFVTNERKEDWRVNLSQPKKRVLGIRPELVAEAISRTGCRVVLLAQNEFYRLVSLDHQGSDMAADSLVEASKIVNEEPTGKWSEGAYRKLIGKLRDGGYEVQAKVIEMAARAGGFIPRSAIYDYAGFAEDRSLRRFALPARRLALTLEEADLLLDEVRPPLEAVYDGPGQAIGYQVPEEFVEYEASDPRQLTWLEAAANVAKSDPDPDRTWTVAALVGEIERRNLRSMVSAKTPEDTLRRDLMHRDDKYFEVVDGGFRLRPTAIDAEF